MYRLIYFKQPDDDEFIYGLREIRDSDVGYITRDIYAGHNVKDLGEKVRELVMEIGCEAIIKNLTKSLGRVIPLDKVEMEQLDKIVYGSGD